MFHLQQCQSRDECESVLKRIGEKFPEEILICRGLKKIQQSMKTYLEGINPTNWCPFGNYTRSEEEDIQYFRGLKSESYGLPKPLFGICTTGAVEGENHALIWNNLRSQSIYDGIQTFLHRIITKNQEKWNLCSKLLKKDIRLTPKASELSESGVQLWEGCTVSALKKIPQV